MSSRAKFERADPFGFDDVLPSEIEPGQKGWQEQLITSCKSLILQVAESQDKLQSLRAERERSERQMLLDFLRVADALDDIFADLTPPHEPPLNFVHAVRELIEIILEEHDVAEISALDQSLDPRLHEVVGWKTTDAGDGSSASRVVEVKKIGYTWKEETLRPAEVIAARAG